MEPSLGEGHHGNSGPAAFTSMDLIRRTDNLRCSPGLMALLLGIPKRTKQGTVSNWYLSDLKLKRNVIFFPWLNTELSRKKSETPILRRKSDVSDR